MYISITGATTPNIKNDRNSIDQRHVPSKQTMASNFNTSTTFTTFTKAGITSLNTHKAWSRTPVDTTTLQKDTAYRLVATGECTLRGRTYVAVPVVTVPAVPAPRRRDTDIKIRRP